MSEQLGAFMFVIPAEAGIHGIFTIDSRLRGNDMLKSAPNVAHYRAFGVSPLPSLTILVFSSIFAVAYTFHIRLIRHKKEVLYG